MNVTARIHLEEFRHKARKRGCGERLALLLEYSKVVVANHENRRRRRKKFRRDRQSKARLLKKAECWVCLVRKARHRHHVIWLAHGGPNNEINIVALCLKCHAKIHPWMAEEERPAVTLPPELYTPLWHPLPRKGGLRCKPT